MKKISTILALAVAFTAIGCQKKSQSNSNQTAVVQSDSRSPLAVIGWGEKKQKKIGRDLYTKEDMEKIEAEDSKTAHKIMHNRKIDGKDAVVMIKVDIPRKTKKLAGYASHTGSEVRLTTEEARQFYEHGGDNELRAELERPKKKK